ncbi:MAG: hypothetical protein Q8P35_00130 [Candidatus Yanofskybacteria bacterium]|nr:hypothetical protein [Candidatus Yanofskybacteria bacterium]
MRIRLKRVVSLNHVRGEVLVAKVRDDGTEDVPESRHIEYDFSVRAWKDNHGGRYPSITRPDKESPVEPAQNSRSSTDPHIVPRILVKMFPGNRMGLFRINGRVRKLILVQGQLWRVAHQNQFFQWR